MLHQRQGRVTRVVQGDSPQPGPAEQAAEFVGVPLRMDGCPGLVCDHVLAALVPVQLGQSRPVPLRGGGPARCLSVEDARRGPPPQRRSPQPPPGGPRRHASADRAWPEQPTRSPCAGRSCRRESSQSRALRPAAFASLRFAPGRPLTATFPGKNRHLPGGRGIEPGPGMGQVSGARLQAGGRAPVSSAQKSLCW